MRPASIVQPIGPPSWIPRSCEIAGNAAVWSAYHNLPSEIRVLAQKSYRLFRDNPSHPSLQFKKIHDAESIYSIRVTLGYRALAISGR